MSVSISGLNELQAELSQMTKRLDSVTELTGDIAQILKSEVSRNFENEKSSFNGSWIPSKRAIKHSSRTLYDDTTPTNKRKHVTHLQDSIYSKHDFNSATVGTNRDYAKYHQFGTAKMPKRDFVPIDESGNLPNDLIEEIIDTTKEYILNNRRR